MYYTVAVNDEIYTLRQHNQLPILIMRIINWRIYSGNESNGRITSLKTRLKPPLL